MAVRAAHLLQLTFPDDESDSGLFFRQLVAQVEKIVHESGNSDGFDASARLARWLTEPLPAFGGRMPLDLADTEEGRMLIAQTLSQMQGGADA